VWLAKDNSKFNPASRKLYDSFEFHGPCGKHWHICLVTEPLSVALEYIRKLNLNDEGHRRLSVAFTTGETDSLWS
jgi:hypothetical protein